MLVVVAAALALAAQTQISPDEVSLDAAPYSPAFAGETIRTQVELVEVPVVVRDAKGNAVLGLQRDDFELFDSGKKQEISSFSIETFPRSVMAEPAAGPTAPSVEPAPTKSASPRRFIALVLDDLNTDLAGLARAKAAAKQFVSQSLAPGDVVGVFSTALTDTVLFTADTAKLKGAIDAVSPHPRFREEKGSCTIIRSFEAYLIANEMDPQLLSAKAAEFSACMHGIPLDAAERAVRARSRAIWENATHSTVNTLDSLAAIVAVMGRMPGQRIVLLTSGGFLSNQQEMRLQTISTAALHSGVIISSLDLKGLYAVVPGGEESETRGLGMDALQIETRAEEAKDDGLAVLASSTGGQFFFNSNNLADGLRRLGAVPEVVYVLAFASGDIPHDGKYHPLKVRLTRGHHGSVQARMGYTAPPRELPSDLARQNERDRLLMSGGTPSDVPVKVTAEPGSDTGPKVSIKTWIDVNALIYEHNNARRVQHLTVIAALLDESGGFVTGRQATANLALSEATFATLAPAGLTVALSLHAAAGDYTLRVLAQEATTGKMTAISMPVRLH